MKKWVLTQYCEYMYVDLGDPSTVASVFLKKLGLFLLLAQIWELWQYK